MKQIDRILAFAICVGVCRLAWEFWMVQERRSLVYWITTDGSLEIDRMPGKNQAGGEGCICTATVEERD